MPCEITGEDGAIFDAVFIQPRFQGIYIVIEKREAVPRRFSYFLLRLPWETGRVLPPLRNDPVYFLHLLKTDRALNLYRPDIVSGQNKPESGGFLAEIIFLPQMPRPALRNEARQHNIE